MTPIVEFHSIILVTGFICFDLIFVSCRTALKAISSTGEVAKVSDFSKLSTLVQSLEKKTCSSKLTWFFFENRNKAPIHDYKRTNKADEMRISLEL